MFAAIMGLATGCSRFTGAPVDAASRPQGTSVSAAVRDSASLPAGTLLSVRLTAPVPAASASGMNSFAGAVEEPIVVRGDTVIPRGATVDGRVESALASDLKPNRGYVRLALESIQVGGSEVPVQTTSLFVRQAALTPASSPMIRVEKGRLLTFRLLNAVTFSVQRTRAGR